MVQSSAHAHSLVLPQSRESPNIQTIQIKLIGKYGTEKQIEEILKMSELDDNKILQKYKNGLVDTQIGD